MSDNPLKISIIIPVYKVEDYLPKCVDSILAQTYNNWELLLIDDGSPDNSGKVCDEYARKDSRIRVFHKENGGVSSARNFGLDVAVGDYIMFVDSDDWISCDCLEVCVNEITKDNLDALQFGLIYVFSNRQCNRVNTATIPLCGEKYIQTQSFNVCAGGGLYKRNIIEEHNLRFPSAIRLAEDQIFVLSFFQQAQQIKYLDKSLYYYLQREDSAVHIPQSKDMLLSCEKLIEFSNNWPVSKSVIDKVIVLFIIDMIKNNDVSYRMLKNIYKRQKVENCNSVYKQQRLFPRIAKFNFNFACIIIRLYQSVRKR